MRLKRWLKKMFSLKLVMTYFIVFLMLGSVLGFVLSERMSNTSVLRFNDFKIDVFENRFVLNYNREKLDFLFPPHDLVHFNVPDTFLNNIRQIPYFTLSYDPRMRDNGELGYLRFIIFEYSYKAGKLVGFGVTEQTTEPLYDGVNVINCDDSTPVSPVVIFTDGDDVIDYNPETGCIVVYSSNAMHRVQFSEKLLYTLLGVME